MELRFKPQFKRDYLKIKNRKVKILLASYLQKITRADTISDAGQLTRLEKYSSRYKIRITVNEKDDYRAGFEIKDDVIWAERILRRPSFYGHYRR